LLAEVDRAVRQARGYVDDVRVLGRGRHPQRLGLSRRGVRDRVAAGARTLNVPDTVGYVQPDEYAKLIRHLRAHVAGADGVTFLGPLPQRPRARRLEQPGGRARGERARSSAPSTDRRARGNTSLEEVVMAIRTRPDVYAGIDTEIVATEIYPSSRLLASTIGVPVQPNKAIVGDNAFAHEAGIHQDGVLKAAITYEIMTPQSIGRASNELVLGKHSGRHAFRERLAELGFELEGEAFQEAFRRFKDLADAKKTIFNEDLEAIASDAVGAHRRALRGEGGDRALGHVRQAHRDRRAPDRQGAAKATALGIGPVDAVFKAIAELTETKSELERFQVNAITGGMDALGEVSVTVCEDGRRVIGNGADPDIIVASARAYVHALNKLEWHKRRHSVAEPKGI
jgi:2-isopropylmalate synthase